MKDRLRTQFATLEIDGRGKYPKYSPFAFTEMGVAMLSSVLRSETAIRVNRAIMRAFVAMRNYITTTTTITAELSEIRAKLALLERSDEDNAEAINDLSEDMRHELDNIYEAIAALSVKSSKATPLRRVQEVTPKDGFRCPLFWSICVRLPRAKHPQPPEILVYLRYLPQRRRTLSRTVVAFILRVTASICSDSRSRRIIYCVLDSVVEV